MSVHLKRDSARRHQEAVAAVRRASFPRRVAIAVVASLSVAFIVSAVALLARVDALQENLAQSVARSTRLRALESMALEGDRLLPAPEGGASLETRVAGIDELLAEIAAIASDPELPAPAATRLGEARDRLTGLRALVESGRPPASGLGDALDVLRSLSAARESARAVAGQAWDAVLAAGRTMNLALIASCAIAAALTVAFALALRRGDALRIAAHEMESSFDRVPEGVALCDDAGTVLRVNSGFARLVGSEQSAIVGASLGRCLAPPSDRPPDGFAAVVRSKSGGGRFEMATRDAEGQPRELSCEMRRIAGVRGSPPLWAIRADDVTEQRRAFAALAERADLLNSLLAASRDGMLLIGPTGRIEYSNRSFGDLVGLDPDSLSGMAARDLAAHLDRRAIDASESFHRLFGEGEDGDRNGSVLPFRTLVRTPGIRALLASAVPVHGLGRRWLGRLAMVRDVTQEENAKRAKDVFVGNVSHELRTPLTSIAGFAEILASGKLGELNERQRETLRIVSESVARLSSLVEDVLAVGEFEEERPRWRSLDLAAVVAEILELERPSAARKNVRIEFERLGEATIEGDARRLHHLFANLVSNAIKYTREGAVKVVIDGREPGYVVAEVVDTGIGIDEADRARVFERFFRASNPETRAVRGTGLGLAIAKLVSDQHEGRIEVESVRGSGSTFRVLLPRARGGAIPPPRSGPAPVERARPLVLAIDDDVFAHRIITAALRVSGIDVICAETAAQGIRAAIESRPDAMIVDVELPDSSGYDVIARLRRDHGLDRTPFVVLSGREPPPSLESLGVTAYLQKPVRSERLREAMVRVLGESRILVDAGNQHE